MKILGSYNSVGHIALGEEMVLGSDCLTSTPSVYTRIASIGDNFFLISIV